MNWLLKVSQQSIENIVMQILRGQINADQAAQVIRNMGNHNACEVLQTMNHTYGHRSIMELQQLLRCSDGLQQQEENQINNMHPMQYNPNLQMPVENEA